MSVSTEFKEIVAKGDKNAVRTSLANYMILDRSYSLFDEAYSYAASQMDILDAHDGQELTQDRTKWTEEYLNAQLVAVVINFSTERIQHIKEIIPVAIPVSKTAAAPKKPTNPAKPQSRTGYTRTETEIPLTQTQPQNRQGRRVSEAPRPSGRTAHTAGTRTGRFTVSETETPASNDEGHYSSGSFDYETALIIGGAALTGVGVAVTEPVVIGAGVIIAGSGCAIKICKKK